MSLIPAFSYTTTLCILKRKLVTSHGFATWRWSRTPLSICIKSLKYNCDGPTWLVKGVWMRYSHKTNTRLRVRHRRHRCVGVWPQVMHCDILGGGFCGVRKGGRIGGEGTTGVEKTERSIELLLAAVHGVKKYEFLWVICCPGRCPYECYCCTCERVRLAVVQVDDILLRPNLVIIRYFRHSW